LGRRLNILAGIGVAGGLLAAALLFSRETRSENPRADGARLMNELMSGKAPVGGPFTLTDPWGRPTALGDFRGKVVLLYFGYTYCPDVCPTDLVAIGAMLRSLGSRGDAVQPLFVTLDPARDTPQVLREYVASFHPRFVALRGNEEETRRVAFSYKVSYEKVRRPGTDAYFIDHMAFTFLLDRDGKYVAFFPPGTSAERMAVMVGEVLEK
jgi:cytochrome oxidase Cu insertion factor (SCO1/SenC/PrrC family)